MTVWILCAVCLALLLWGILLTRAHRRRSKIKKRPKRRLPRIVPQTNCRCKRLVLTMPANEPLPSTVKKDR